MKAEIGTPGRVLPGRVDAGALRGADGEARVGVRGEAAAAGGPVAALPIDQMRGRRIGQPLPPHVAVVRERDVGEDHVAVERLDGVGVGLDAGSRRHAEETGLGIDRAQLPSGCGLIQAMSSPMVRTFQPSNAVGGTSMARLVLPQAEGNAAAT